MCLVSISIVFLTSNLLHLSRILRVRLRPASNSQSGAFVGDKFHQVERKYTLSDLTGVTRLTLLPPPPAALNRPPGGRARASPVARLPDFPVRRTDGRGLRAIGEAPSPNLFRALLFIPRCRCRRQCPRLLEGTAILKYVITDWTFTCSLRLNV